MTRTRLALLLTPLLLLAAAYAFRAPLAMRIAERGIERSLSAEPFAALQDGISLALCGAGGPLPDPKRSGPCVAVQAGKLHLVIDAGSGGARNLTRMRFPLGNIDALLLTHFHSDHIDGMGELAMLRWVNAANAAPLPVLGPPGTAQVVAGFNGAYAADARYRSAHHGDVVAPLSGHGMQASEFTVRMFAVNHAPVDPAVGYRIEYGGRSVVVSGDTARSTSLETVAKGADLLVHEALSHEMVGAMHRAAEAAKRPIIAKVTTDIPGYHSSPVDAAKSATAAGVQHLLLYHVVPPLMLPGMEAAFLQGVPEAFSGPVTLGVDGSLFNLPADTNTVEKLPNAL
jgi:ribonuclease Z